MFILMLFQPFLNSYLITFISINLVITLFSYLTILMFNILLSRVNLTAVKYQINLPFTIRKYLKGTWSSYFSPLNSREIMLVRFACKFKIKYCALPYCLSSLLLYPLPLTPLSGNNSVEIRFNMQITAQLKALSRKSRKCTYIFG